MLTSVVTFYDNETGPSSTASLLYPPRRPSFLIANILRFLALRREGFVLHFRAMPLSQDSNRDTAIKTPDKPSHFNHFQFSNRDKTQGLHPQRISGSASFSPSLPPRFSLSESLCPRASVANLCDNGWLKLRLM